MAGLTVLTLGSKSGVLIRAFTPMQYLYSTGTKNPSGHDDVNVPRRDGEFGLAFGLQTLWRSMHSIFVRVLNQIEEPIGLVRGNFFF